MLSQNQQLIFLRWYWEQKKLHPEFTNAPSSVNVQVTFTVSQLQLIEPNSIVKLEKSFESSINDKCLILP
jgi:hypothetical protein